VRAPRRVRVNPLRPIRPEASPSPCEKFVESDRLVAKLAAMGTVRPPRRVNLVCGILSGDEDLMARAIQLLKRRIGPIDEVSEIWPFDTTHYYEPEMGPNLKRRFVSFAELIDPVQLPYLKLLTNDLEASIGHDQGLQSPGLPARRHLRRVYAALPRRAVGTLAVDLPGLCGRAVSRLFLAGA